MNGLDVTRMGVMPPTAPEMSQEWFQPEIPDDEPCFTPFHRSLTAFFEYSFAFVIWPYENCDFCEIVGDTIAKIVLLVCVIFLALPVAILSLVQYLARSWKPLPTSDATQTVFSLKVNDRSGILVNKAPETRVLAPFDTRYHTTFLTVSNHLLMSPINERSAHKNSIYTVDYESNQQPTITVERVKASEKALKIVVQTDTGFGPATKDVVYVDTANEIALPSPNGEAEGAHPAYPLYRYCPKQRSMEEAITTLASLVSDEYDIRNAVLALAQNGLVVACRVIPGSEQVDLYVVPPLEQRPYAAAAVLPNEGRYNNWGADSFKEIWLHIDWAGAAIRIDNLLAQQISPDAVRARAIALIVEQLVELTPMDAITINTITDYAIPLPSQAPVIPNPTIGLAIAPMKSSPRINHVVTLVKV